MGLLLNSYLALGIPAGAPLTVALRRYRWLAQVFHPDRFVDSRRATAEQEMKRINAARDILRTHFALKHKSPSELCDCEAWVSAEAKTTSSFRKESRMSPQQNTDCAPARTPDSSDQPRRAKMITSTRTSYRKDNASRATRNQPDASTAPGNWQKRSGTYRISGVDYASRLAAEQELNNDFAQSGSALSDKVKCPSIKAKAQPIILPQWFLLVMALLFFSMAMSLNHQNSLSMQYGGGPVQTQ